MNESDDMRPSLPRKGGERGGARLKFIIVLAMLAILISSALQYVPVAVQAYQYRDLMQQTVDKALMMGKTPDWVNSQLRASAKDYGVPPNANIIAAPRENRIEARAQFTRPVPLPGGGPLALYNYQYNFDQTVKSMDAVTLK
jgi:hypothetical protein